LGQQGDQLTTNQTEWKVLKKESSPDMKMEGASSRQYKTANFSLKKEIRQAHHFQGNFKAIQASQHFSSVQQDINSFGFLTTSDVDLKPGTRRYYSRPKLILTDI
jgi:hypothetical protein